MEKAADREKWEEITEHELASPLFKGSNKEDAYI